MIPALGRLRQEDRCEFETSLGSKSELKASQNCKKRQTNIFNHDLGTHLLTK